MAAMRHKPPETPPTLPSVDLHQTCERGRALGKMWTTGCEPDGAVACRMCHDRFQAGLP